MLRGALEQPVARHGLEWKGGSPPGSSLEGKEMRGWGGKRARRCDSRAGTGGVPGRRGTELCRDRAGQGRSCAMCAGWFWAGQTVGCRACRGGGLSASGGWRGHRVPPGGL